MTTPEEALPEVRVICDKVAAHKDGRDVIIGDFQLTPLILGNRLGDGPQMWIRKDKKPGAGKVVATDMQGLRFRLLCRQCGAGVTVLQSTLDLVLGYWYAAAPGKPLDITGLSRRLGDNPLGP